MQPKSNIRGFMNYKLMNEGHNVVCICLEMSADTVHERIEKYCSTKKMNENKHRK